MKMFVRCSLLQILLSFIPIGQFALVQVVMYNGKPKMTIELSPYKSIKSSHNIKCKTIIS